VLGHGRRELAEAARAPPEAGVCVGLLRQLEHAAIELAERLARLTYRRFSSHSAAPDNETAIKAARFRLARLNVTVGF